MRDLINIVEGVAGDISVLPEIIIKTRQAYNDRGITTYQIGNGHCDDFADDVLQEWIGPDWIGLDGKGMFDQAETGMFCTYPDNDGWPHDWDWELLAKYWNIYPPPGHTLQFLKELAVDCPGHTWIAAKGKHYDSESPEGVDSFFDLMFFKRYLGREK